MHSENVQFQIKTSNDEITLVADFNIQKEKGYRVFKLKKSIIENAPENKGLMLSGTLTEDLVYTPATEDIQIVREKVVAEIKENINTENFNVNNLTSIELKIMFGVGKPITDKELGI